MHRNARKITEHEAQDDVSSLFRRLGASREASGYRDFAPVALPTRPAPHQAPEEGLQTTVGSSSAVNVTLRPLQSTSSFATESASACATKSEGLTPLEALFKRLLQADVSNQSVSVLKRLLR